MSRAERESSVSSSRSRLTTTLRIGVGEYWLGRAIGVALSNWSAEFIPHKAPGIYSGKLESGIVTNHLDTECRIANFEMKR